MFRCYNLRNLLAGLFLFFVETISYHKLKCDSCSCFFFLDKYIYHWGYSVYKHTFYEKRFELLSTVSH